MIAWDCVTAVPRCFTVDGCLLAVISCRNKALFIPHYNIRYYHSTIRPLAQCIHSQILKNRNSFSFDLCKSKLMFWNVCEIFIISIISYFYEKITICRKLWVGGCCAIVEEVFLFCSSGVTPFWYSAFPNIALLFKGKYFDN